MNAKLLKTSLMLLSILTLTACSCKPEIKYVDKPYEVKVPVKCVVPDSNCSFNSGSYTEVIGSMVECIVTIKHNEKVCK